MYVCLLVCPNELLWAFHRKMGASFVMKLFFSVLYVCETATVTYILGTVILKIKFSPFKICLDLDT